MTKKDEVVEEKDEVGEEKDEVVEEKDVVEAKLFGGQAVDWSRDNIRSTRGGIDGEPKFGKYERSD